MMMTKGGFPRSHDIKEVIHVKANKFSGYFDTECKKFAVDPHVTSFAHIKEILDNAFNLDGSFEVSYLCQDDKGEDVYLSLHTDWDLDAAFLTSSDPCLILRVESQRCEEDSRKISHKEMKQSGCSSSGMETILGFATATDFQVPPSWSEFAGNAIAKITGSIGQSLHSSAEGMFFPKNAPLGDCEIHNYLDKHGRLIKPEELRLRVYYGGILPSIRKVAWRLLLNIFPARLTAQERVLYMKKKTKEYHQLYTQWKSLHNHLYVQDLKRMIWKDVLRTDRSHPYFSGPDDNPHLTSLHNLLLTYALTHEKVRYCQGMSDLAAPLLVVMNNEPHAYVCFCGLMARLADNFSSDGAVMSKKFQHLALLLQYHDSEFFNFLKSMGADNMYFCYRWLLLEMKREFDFNDALVVLEVMWSSLPPQPPEDDLPLGVLNIHDGLSTSRRSNTASSKRNSLPDLTLNVKNLPTARVDKAPPGSQTDLMTEKNSRPYLPPSYQNDGTIMTKKQLDKNRDVRSRLGEGMVISRGAKKQKVFLPPPEKLGCGNPFLLFVCLSVLLEQKNELMSSKTEYADLVMHFDKMVRAHSPGKILSMAMQFFASYLQAQSFAVS